MRTPATDRPTDAMTDATIPSPPPMTLPSVELERVRAEVDRLAASVAGAGVAVAAFSPGDGTLLAGHDGGHAFFSRHVFPAYAAGGPIAAPAAGEGPPRVAGVRAVLLPAPRRANATFAIFGRCAEAATFATLDVAALAAITPDVSAALLDRLAALCVATFRADQQLATVQRDLDALSTQLADTYEELTLIYQVSSGMRINRGVDDFFLQTCNDVIGVIDVRGAGYVVTNADGQADAAAIYGEVELSADVSARLAGDLLARFAGNAKPLLVNDLAADPTFHYLAPASRRFVAVAIQRQERLLGTLFCLDKRDREFTTQDSKLLNSIGNETAIYLENSALFADARGLMMGLLHALTSAVDAKDAYTCGHSQRVALFGREIAQQFGLPEQQCERVYMAGLLHDVGKIGVPEEVLRKPGKLTNDEFDLMKKHVDIGSHILKDLRQIEDLVPGVLHHHERYDGKGYPHNLAGHDIPQIARILCVADCFDAMTSNRTYRKALPVEVAMMEIRRCSGTQFDPLLADAFLAIGEPRLREMIQSVAEPAGMPAGMSCDPPSAIAARLAA